MTTGGDEPPVAFWADGIDGHGKLIRNKYITAPLF
jgi:hypothetical protein